MTHPGPVLFFGSGETSPAGQKAFDALFQRLPASPRVALLETPAGFELNSAQVVGRIAAFLEHRLQNYHPQTHIIPARARGTAWSPDDPDITAPLLQADLIFMGPGSPTYAARQLGASLAWQSLVARHRAGAALAFASAAVIAAGAWVLPVYEIYKAGEDLHWKPGLDLFAQFGLSLVFVPHWNNTDGGEELDTSRCFMGKSRFSRLMEMLPTDLTLVGIDEQTTLLFDLQAGTAQVLGKGGVTLVHTGKSHAGAATFDDLLGTGLAELASRREAHVHYTGSGDAFPLEKLGRFRLPGPGVGEVDSVWQQANRALEEPGRQTPSEDVVSLVEQRELARQQKDWAAADRLRDDILASGWQVLDTPDGPQLTPSK